MKNFKLRLWLTLTAIGLVGVASLLLSDLPLENLPEEVTKTISPEALKLLLLINPAFLLIIATTSGTLLYDKVNLRAPVFEKILNKPGWKPFSLTRILLQGVALGFLAGVMIVITSNLLDPYLPQVFKDASKDTSLNIVTKLLYGGITEELLTRFGLMSLLTWVFIRITKKMNNLVYWSAIILSSLLFALGHLPVVFHIVSEPTFAIYVYIIAGNSIGGLIFGYAFWKKGLECAFIAHSLAHLTILAVTI